MNVLLKRTPSGALATHVESLWALTALAAGDGVTRMPTIRSHLVWPLPGSRTQVRTFGATGGVQTIDGPMLCIADTTGHSVSQLDPLPRLVLGAEFAPGGVPSFLRRPLSDLRHATLPLTQVWGEAVVQQGTACLSAALQHSVAATLTAFETLLQSQWQAPAEDAFPVQEALAALLLAQDAGGVANVAQRFGMNTRQFREKVREATGLTPKRYARLQRFTAALRGLHRRSADTDAALAAECGYFDQAHFIHEFKAMAGMTPSDYRSAHGDGAHSACLFTALRQRLAAMVWPDAQVDVDDQVTAAAAESRAAA
jgi:AraC-like DNA-binding protein